MSVDTLRESDHAQWSELWRQYLEFYKATLPQEIYDNTWSKIISSTPGEFSIYGLCIRAESGDLLGITHFQLTPDAWTIGPVCYLNDLFVSPDHRGKGYGRKLIEGVGEKAKAMKCEYVYWITQETNKTARRLYDKVAEQDFIRYRMGL